MKNVIVVSVFILSLIIILYFITIYNPVFIFEILPSWLIGILFWLSCLLIGYRIANHFPYLIPLPLKLSSLFFFGSTCLLILLIILLFTNLFFHRIIIAILAAALILNIKFISKIKNDILEIFTPRNLPYPNSSALTIILLIQTIILLFAASTPPYFYDSMVYHIAMPAKYLQHHGFFYYEDVFFTSFPMNASLFFAIPLAFKLDMAAHIINVIFTLMTTLAIFEFSKHYFSQKVASLAAIIFITTPLTSLSAIIPAAEPSLTFYSFLSFLLLLSHIDNKNAIHLILSGASAGIALGIKYTHAAYLIMILLFLLPFLPKTHSLKSGLIIISGLLLFATIIFSPWLIKNIVIHNDPLYPYFSKFSSNTTEIIYQLTPKTNLLTSIKNYLLTPLYMNFKNMGAAGIIGPIFLILLPWLIAGSKKQHRFFKLFLVSSVAGIITFTITVHWLRLFLPIIPIMSVLYASALLNIKNTLLEKTYKFATFIPICFNILILLNHIQIFGLFNYAFGAESKDKFLPPLVEYYPVAKFIQRIAPSYANILFIGECRTYYFENNCIPHFPPEHPITIEKWLKKSSSISEFISILKKNNVQLILFNNYRINSALANSPNKNLLQIQPATQKIFDDFMKHYTVEIYKDDFYSLYKINYQKSFSSNYD